MATPHQVQQLERGLLKLKEGPEQNDALKNVSRKHYVIVLSHWEALYLYRYIEQLEGMTEQGYVLPLWQIDLGE